MGINVSGGMANARRRQRNAARRKKQETLRKRRENAADQDEDEFLEDDLSAYSEEFTETKLGKFLDFIDPFMIALIVINAIQMGLGTFNFVEDNKTVNDTFELVDRIFLIIFTIEVVLNFIHYVRLDRVQIIDSKPVFPFMTNIEREKRRSDRGWLIFDASVVIFSWVFAKLSVIRSFRILRVLRLVKKVKSLKNVVRALFATGAQMGVVTLFLSILMLVFGIACTVLFGDLYERGYTSENYFSRIDYTFLTLFQIMTFDSWHEVARECMDVYPWSWVVFVSWAIITGFVIMNLIIAIICESLKHCTEIEMNAKEKEEKKAMHLEKNGDKEKFYMSTGMGLAKGESTRTTLSEASDAAVDFHFMLEELVEEILEDQEELLKTVDDLMSILLDVLMYPPTAQRAHNIRTNGSLQPQSRNIYAMW